MADPHPPEPPRRPLAHRLQPLADACYKLLIATAAAIAIWKGLR